MADTTLQPTNQIPAGLDPTAFILTKAIKQQETGGSANQYTAKGASGEFGAYQYTPDTWAADSTKYLGQSVPLTQATPEQQNQVAYSSIADQLKQGKNQSQIASWWNSGNYDASKVGTGTNSYGVNYNVPAYVDGVKNNYLQIQKQFLGDNSISIQEPQTPSVGGFIENAANSVGNVLGGLGNAVMHPIDTIKNLASTGAGAVESGLNTLGVTNINNQDTQNFGNIVDYYKNRYGGNSLSEIGSNILKTAYNDPAGTALDLSTLLDGVGAGIGVVGKIADISKAADLAKASDFISTAQGLVKSNTPEAIKALQTPGFASQLGDSLQTVSKYINPLTPVVGAASKVINKGIIPLGTSVASHVMSLSDPASVTEIFNNPELYSKMAREQVNRGSVAEEFGNSIDNLEKSTQETGSGYNSIRQSLQPISVPEGLIPDALAKFGLKTEPVIENGIQTGSKVIADSLSKTRNVSDINAIQKFVDDWGNKSSLTPAEFLNMRSDLSELANYDKFGTGGKTKTIQVIADGVRDKVNEVLRPRIKGLQQLDEQYSPQIKQLGQARKDFLIRTSEGYVFKDGALNKIANAANKGKDALLGRMEAISPGITRKLQILKTVEDIDSSFKIKAGSYVRGILEGGGIMSGNVPAVIAGIITHPAIAIPLLRGLGWSAQKVSRITGILKMVAGDPQTLKLLSQAGTISSASNAPTSNGK